MGIAIQVSDLTKIYQRYSHRKQFRTLKSALLRGSLLQELRPDERFLALEGVTFNVREGSTFALIGRNGSGKSTLLKVIAGISKPSGGTVKVNGRVSALIELGAGFHPEITGRENVFINGIMLGLTKREIEERYEEIVAFAELEDFIEAPVKTYSSGMYMRLGFAVAIHVDPDILLIDEVLAVGDEAFVHKCIDKISELRRRGKTILLVTHSLGLVEKMADEALWIDRSRVQMRGDPKKVVDAYLALVTQHEEVALAAAEARTAAEFDAPRREDDGKGSDVEPVSAFARERGRWGSREVEIQEVSFLDASGSAKHVFATGESVTVRLNVSTTGTIEDFAFGVAIFNADGICCYGTNTHLEEFTPVRLSGAAEVRFVIPELQLIEGTYFLDVAAHQRDGYPFDYHRALHQFRVQSKVKDVGVYRPHHRWEFAGGVRLDPPRPVSRLAKILGRAEMAEERRRLRERGETLVFTNGCFDLLHPGHVRYLREAKGLGDRLVVAVNGDETVTRLKGEGRPLTPLAERMEILAAVASVDYVVSFEEETPFEIVEEIVPDVLVKGGDWTPDRIVGRERVEKEGGKVLSLPYAPGYSTSLILERIVETRDPKNSP